jgi:predicted RNA-binding protein with PIN domain
VSSRNLVQLLIDGYNLLHASGVFGESTGADGFHQSRMALLDALADSLSEKERKRTLIVFDAAGAPPGLPQSLTHRAIRVRFARGHADADELIELLIEAHKQPKQLLVVSTDRRIQRAARLKGASRSESEAWFRELRSRPNANSTGEATSAKPQEAPSEDEVAFWLKEFGASAAEPASHGPFPPGYGEDIDEA